MIANTPVTSLTTTDAAGRGLHVEFLQHADRYGYRIFGIAPEAEPVLLLESLEGDQSQGVRRPALQGLNREQLDGHNPGDGPPPPAMLFGMSGDVRWSLSIEAVKHEGGPAIVFDLAARLAATPLESVEAAWQASPTAVLDADGSAYFGGAARRFTLEPIALGDQSPCRLALESGRLSARLAVDGVAPPATLRWGCRLSSAAS